MSAAADQRLERLLRASEAAGKVVAEAIVGPEGIRLVYVQPSLGEVVPADLIKWKRPA